LVERRLAKAKVAGSRPVSRSNFEPSGLLRTVFIHPLSVACRNVLCRCFHPVPCISELVEGLAEHPWRRVARHLRHPGEALYFSERERGERVPGLVRSPRAGACAFYGGIPDPIPQTWREERRGWLGGERAHARHYHNHPRMYPGSSPAGLLVEHENSLRRRCRSSLSIGVFLLYRLAL
jgi:hypothetical protein